jgi:succinyl-CoA synthetase alpha subunit
MKKNRVYAGIDLDALRYNMESMHKNIKEGTKIAAVIKADAYGHGALTVAKTIEDLPYVWGFAVATADEAAEAGIKVIVCITEGIPVADMVKVKEYIKDKGARLIGPNCPGIITSDEAKIGIMPGFVFKKGRVGIVSKSGTLTYEAADQVVRAGFGVSTAIGIGGDPIIGTTTKEALELFINDPETDAVVMIGEIGGSLEAEAARWYRDSGSKKPVVGFIAGQTAPKGRTMGHAGAIVGGAEDTAQAKMQIMEECGINVVASPADIGKTIAKVLG